MLGIALVCVFTVPAAQAKPAPLTASDTAAILKAARGNQWAPRAEIFAQRGDTVYVAVGTRVSTSDVRVVRREKVWVALKDSTLVRTIR